MEYVAIATLLRDLQMDHHYWKTLFIAIGVLFYLMDRGNDKIGGDEARRRYEVFNTLLFLKALYHLCLLLIICMHLLYAVFENNVR